MQPLEHNLQSCFNEMRFKIESMENNKNYFAMSLKMFFIELSTEFPDLLELMCHNYVHKWVSKGIQKRKDQLEVRQSSRNGGFRSTRQMSVGALHQEFTTTSSNYTKAHAFNNS